MPNTYPFYDQHYDFLEEIGVVNKIKEFENRNRLLNSLIEINHRLINQDRVSKLISIIVTSCFENFPINKFSVFVSSSKSNGILKPKIFYDFQEQKELEDKYCLNKNNSFVSSVQKLNIATKYYDFIQQNEKNINKNTLKGLEPEIIVPMKTSTNMFVGFFVVGKKKDNSEFEIHEIQFLNAISNMVCVSIENSRLKKIVLRDERTNLFSYDYFIEQMQRELEISLRYDKVLSIALGNIDQFKKANETFGREFGDKILKHIAKLITSSLRKVDIVARFSGEEFAILMPMTASQGAFFAIDRVRQKIAKQTFTYQDKSLKLTVSFGIASLRDGNYTMLEDFIDFAKIALERAKENGRNMVVHIDDEKEWE